MIHRSRCFSLSEFFLLGIACLSAEAAVNGNRLTYLDEADPFYPGLTFPKLVTPQWVGDSNVEAVVVLAIDDMRDPQKYETYLRPILDRLKRIDGRAPVSIFCNALDPEKPQLQAWLREGLSLEIHTLSHPCPLLARSNFQAALDTYHGCVDLLSRVPGNKPVAYRMPCCDSMNSPSPRFYAEIFNGTNSAGQFLTIDSSVMNILTSGDRSLPREWTVEPDGRERFRKYVPFPSFVTTIENYPYPYVIGRLCWEFPPTVPSDWEAQNLHGVNNPDTVRDWKIALDATVRKQGVFTFIFHPHGWIRPDQLVEFIDYAAGTYGSKVRFLNFREAEAELNKNLFLGKGALRDSSGRDAGMRLIDLNNDGFLDVVMGNSEKLSRVWDPASNKWLDSAFPVELVRPDKSGVPVETGVQFAVVRPDGMASAFLLTESESKAWHFSGREWVEDAEWLRGLRDDRVRTRISGPGGNLVDGGVRFRDLDNDGRCECLVSRPGVNLIFGWSDEAREWKPLSYALPEGVSLVDAEGRDNGVRFVDLNEDGYPDLVASNPAGYSVHLFTPRAAPHLSWTVGWSQKVKSGSGKDPKRLPLIVRDGPYRQNGVWFHSKQMWVQNEDTADLADKVDRRSFTELLAFDVPAPKSPEESLRSIRIRPGFKLELVAAEPLVMDPIAFEWGADGKLWVVEMGDYPVGIDGKGKPGGIVRFLEDADGDGRYDRSTVFLDGLNFPTGVMPWRKGVLVSAAPEILYAEDTDGDGRADVREVLFSGFREGNQQHRVNGFELGLDNWIYGANGDSGGIILSHRTGKRVDIRGRDFRFRPDTGEFETVAGQTQFGRRRDDWGNWFGNNNPAWGWHYYLAEHYLARNPHLAVRNTKRYLAQYENGNHAYAISPPMQRFNWPDLVNTVTSANSPTPYRDELFGPEHASSLFVSEPANNLIHREVLEPDGISFRSRRAAGEEESEFLASTDNWFRPTMLKTGPDGAVYFADMYRLVIEHIEYGLPGMERQIDLRAGHDRGRIYRFYPEGAHLRPIPRLDKLGVDGWVQALASPNGWQRDTAHRLLLEAADSKAIEPLRRLIAETATAGGGARGMSESVRAKVRLQALCVLEGLNGVTPEILGSVLEDAHPAVREHAVRLAEPFLRRLTESGAGKAGEDSEAEQARIRGLLERLVRLADDPSVRVRSQLAFSLGDCADPRAGEALLQICLKDRSNPDMQTAVLSSALPHLPVLLSGVFDVAEPDPPGHLMRELLALAVMADRLPLLHEPVRRIAASDAARPEPWRWTALSGLFAALERQGRTFSELFEAADSNLKEALKGLERVVGSARAAALEADAPEPVRIAAVRLLGKIPHLAREDWEALSALLLPQVSGSLQKAALESLGRASDVEVSELLLKNWNAYAPGMKEDVATVLLSRPGWTGRFVRAVGEGRVAPAQVRTSHRQKLLTHPDPEIRKSARELFPTDEDRKAVVERFRSVLALEGNPGRGAAVFSAQCATCHTFRGQGHPVGPSLDALTDPSAEELLVSILDPNQAVEAPFASYSVVTKSGRELTGVIASETATSLTLRMAGGVEETILRQDLAELSSSGLSMMPDGFEQTMSAQELADLLAFLRRR